MRFFFTRRALWADREYHARAAAAELLSEMAVTIESHAQFKFLTDEADTAGEVMKVVEYIEQTIENLLEGIEVV